MSKVFYRQLREHYPVVAGGRGCYLFDRAGKRYLDASGGAAVSCLGHNHPRVVEAIRRQVETIAYAHTAFFTSDAAEELAELLIRRAPPGMARVYYTSGGSEAIEAALKMARQYFVEKGEPARTRFLARRQSYHGNTLGALAVGGNRWRREAFAPLLGLQATHLTPCYPFRERRPGEDDDAFLARLLAELEETIQALGPETVIAFVAEPVVGATLGAVPALPGYFQGVKAILDRYGILLILDEVMCGMGRTGTLYACEQEGVVPDLIAVAKGLGGGYQPIGAVVVHERVVEAFVEGSGVFQHGHTYMGHPTACAAALAVQRVIEEEDLLARVRAMGERLQAGLEERFADHPHIADLRGRGLFRGFEIVRERTHNTPFPPELALHARIKRAAMELGLICYPGHGTIDGRRGHHMLLAPPFIISEAEMEELLELLASTFDRVFRELPDHG